MEPASSATPVQNFVTMPGKQAAFWDMEEERVERMLESGRRIMRAAIEQYKPVAIFAGFSGGNDSVVATHFACTEFGAAAVHANTMIGVEKSREHARRTAKRYGWQFLEYKAEATGPPKKHKNGMPFDAATLPAGKWTDGNTQYEEWCFNFGMPGPGQHARMYQRLKERSFERLRRDAKRAHKRSDCVVMVTGIRHDESSIRAGYQRDTQKAGSTIWVNPFYWQTKADFEAYRQEFGLPRNPLTDVIGISGECLCGTMGTRDELDLIEKIEPETRQYIEGLESRCESLGLPCKWATKPEKPSKCNPLQMLLFGDEPSFQPACVGCMRRRTE
jgi:3'-phosphoadenosine 5'-phosphosulfate sulfotransferase (PAPS reductase)/FAD synthetase